MPTRKDYKKRIGEIQRELRKIDPDLRTYCKKACELWEKEDALMRTLHTACDELGKTWADTCPSFKKIEEHTSCIIWEWTDSQKTAKYCINCPISYDEARVRTMMCKLRPPRKDENG